MKFCLKVLTYILISGGILRESDINSDLKQSNLKQKFKLQFKTRKILNISKYTLSSRDKLYEKSFHIISPKGKLSCNTLPKALKVKTIF